MALMQGSHGGHEVQGPPQISPTPRCELTTAVKQLHDHKKKAHPPDWRMD
jgi:hypothetical protein